ncbi:hypothetical protein A0H81_13153 [Grifola frondosa]|uniref:Uncharacterized protein n=1 Tax=Grifola frondosa TaxID=5627 RepID=A0A1C7LPT8_GRIFR|nr:hypothetical protein A0H81_13153 [Grifola frondosa]
MAIKMYLRAYISFSHDGDLLNGTGHLQDDIQIQSGTALGVKLSEVLSVRNVNFRESITRIGFGTIDRML